MRGVRALQAVLACLLLVAATGGAAAGVDSAQRPAPTAAIDTGPAQVDTPVAQANNSTVRHEDPNSVDSPNDGQLRSYLEERLAAQLQGSVINLTRGEYEQARSRVGEEFAEDFEKYVDVAGGPEDNDAAEAFETARDRQQRYINQTQEYRETKAEYREAVASGNESRARELARELSRTATRINETQRNLSASYTALENRSGTNLSREQDSLQQNTDRITDDAANITRSTFTQTRLSLSADVATVSFLDPLRLSGRLVTENGTPVSNRTVLLGVGDRRLTVDTGSDGTFSLQYRPTRLPLDAETLTVDYLPADDAAYLGSNASVSVDPRQVDATTTVNTVETARFGQNVTVRGRVDVDDLPVPGVPVRITLGGTTVATTRTNESGGYAVTFSLPADVPTGSRALTASLAQTDRAVAGSSVDTTVEIVSTATTLELDASRPDDETTRLSGRLQTGDGTPLQNQSIALAMDGTVLASVETDSDGRFVATVQPPTSVSDASTVTVRATFDGQGSNLESARASQALSLGSEQSAGLLQLARGNTGAVLVGGAGLLAVVSAAGLVLVLRRPDAESGAAGSSPVSPARPSAAVDDQTTARQRIEDAEAHLEETPSLAVEFAFTGVRETLGSRVDVDDSATAREFARAYRDATSTEDSEPRLEQLVDLYERAAFGPTAVSQEDARSAVAVARELVSHRQH